MDMNSSDDSGSTMGLRQISVTESQLSTYFSGRPCLTELLHQEATIAYIATYNNNQNLLDGCIVHVLQLPYIEINLFLILIAEAKRDISSTWRLKERMKTVGVVVVICLNNGVDPPNVFKPNPCARKECW